MQKNWERERRKFSEVKKMICVQKRKDWQQEQERFDDGDFVVEELKDEEKIEKERKDDVKIGFV